MSDDGITVELCGKTTPLVLREPGPGLSDLDLARFEAKLGHKLPAAYREFLLKYNGGRPVSGEILGRDDDPNTPYEHGDGVEVLFKLPTRAKKVPSHQRLVTPGEHVWNLPGDLLAIGADAGGNKFVLELGRRGSVVRFLNHERLDEPFESHRILADDFLDFAMRFRSVEAMKALQEAARKAERAALERGAFPLLLERQCQQVEARFPEVRSWLRAACLQVFDAKGHFSLHADEASMTVFDAAVWLAWESDGRVFTGSDDVGRFLGRTWLRGDIGFGLSGYAPEFIRRWWGNRGATGRFDHGADGFRLAADAAEDLRRRLLALAQGRRGGHG